MAALDPQQTALEHVEETLRTLGGLGAAEAATRARDILSRLGLGARLHALPREMSGGEQQMLTIARTLMGNPLAVLLDEPSEGLAPVIVEQMAGAIRDLKREGLTLLISEQNLTFAATITDRAYVLEQGSVRHASGMRELMADEATRHKYLAV